MRNIILAAAILSLCAACSSTPSAPVALTKGNANMAPGPATTAPLRTESAESRDIKEFNDLLTRASIYFDYDKYTIDEQYRAMILAHANYLHRHPNTRVTLEGNADDRGSSEYNLALGQRRAEVVRQMMLSIGVASNQLEAVSFGKEKPKALGNTEAAWAQNRRTDLRYQYGQ